MPSPTPEQFDRLYEILQTELPGSFWDTYIDHRRVANPGYGEVIFMPNPGDNRHQKPARVFIVLSANAAESVVEDGGKAHMVRNYLTGGMEEAFARKITGSYVDIEPPKNSLGISIPGREWHNIEEMYVPCEEDGAVLASGAKFAKGPVGYRILGSCPKFTVSASVGPEDMPTIGLPGNVKAEVFRQVTPSTTTLGAYRQKLFRMRVSEIHDLVVLSEWGSDPVDLYTNPGATQEKIYNLLEEVLRPPATVTGFMGKVGSIYPKLKEYSNHETNIHWITAAFLQECGILGHEAYLNPQLTTKQQDIFSSNRYAKPGLPSTDDRDFPNVFSEDYIGAFDPREKKAFHSMLLGMLDKDEEVYREILTSPFVDSALDNIFQNPDNPFGMYLESNSKIGNVSHFVDSTAAPGTFRQGTRPGNWRISQKTLGLLRSSQKAINSTSYKLWEYEGSQGLLFGRGMADPQMSETDWRIGDSGETNGRAFGVAHRISYQHDDWLAQSHRIEAERIAKQHARQKSTKKEAGGIRDPILQMQELQQQPRWAGRNGQLKNGEQLDLQEGFIFDPLEEKGSVTVQVSVKQLDATKQDVSIHSDIGTMSISDLVGLASQTSEISLFEDAQVKPRIAADSDGIRRVHAPQGILFGVEQLRGDGAFSIERRVDPEYISFLLGASTMPIGKGGRLTVGDLSKTLTDAGLIPSNRSLKTGTEPRAPTEHKAVEDAIAATKRRERNKYYTAVVTPMTDQPGRSYKEALSGVKNQFHKTRLEAFSAYLEEKSGRPVDPRTVAINYQDTYRTIRRAIRRSIATQDAQNAFGTSEEEVRHAVPGDVTAHAHHRSKQAEFLTGKYAEGMNAVAAFMGGVASGEQQDVDAFYRITSAAQDSRSAVIGIVQHAVSSKPKQEIFDDETEELDVPITYSHAEGEDDVRYSKVDQIVDPRTASGNDIMLTGGNNAVSMHEFVKQGGGKSLLHRNKFGDVDALVAEAVTKGNRLIATGKILSRELDYQRELLSLDTKFKELDPNTTSPVVRDYWDKRASYQRQIAREPLHRQRRLYGIVMQDGVPTIATPEMLNTAIARNAPLPFFGLNPGDLGTVFDGKSPEQLLEMARDLGLRASHDLNANDSTMWRIPKRPKTRMDLPEQLADISKESEQNAFTAEVKATIHARQGNYGAARKELMLYAPQFRREMAVLGALDFMHQKPLDPLMSGYKEQLSLRSQTGDRMYASLGKLDQALADKFRAGALSASDYLGDIPVAPGKESELYDKSIEFMARMGVDPSHGPISLGAQTIYKEMYTTGILRHEGFTGRSSSHSGYNFIGPVHQSQMSIPGTPNGRLLPVETSQELLELQRVAGLNEEMEMPNLPEPITSFEKYRNNYLRGQVFLGRSAQEAEESLDAHIAEVFSRKVNTDFGFVKHIVALQEVHGLTFTFDGYGRGRFAVSDNNVASFKTDHGATYPVGTGSHNHHFIADIGDIYRLFGGYTDNNDFRAQATEATHSEDAGAEIFQVRDKQGRARTLLHNAASSDIGSDTIVRSYEYFKSPQGINLVGFDIEVNRRGEIDAIGLMKVDDKNETLATHEQYTREFYDRERRKYTEKYQLHKWLGASDEDFEKMFKDDNVAKGRKGFTLTTSNISWLDEVDHTKSQPIWQTDVEAKMIHKSRLVMENLVEDGHSRIVIHNATFDIPKMIERARHHGMTDDTEALQRIGKSVVIDSATLLGLAHPERSDTTLITAAQRFTGFRFDQAHSPIEDIKLMLGVAMEAIRHNLQFDRDAKLEPVTGLDETEEPLVMSFSDQAKAPILVHKILPADPEAGRERPQILGQRVNTKKLISQGIIEPENPDEPVTTLQHTFGSGFGLGQHVDEGRTHLETQEQIRNSPVIQERIGRDIARATDDRAARIVRTARSGDPITREFHVMRGEVAAGFEAAPDKIQYIEGILSAVQNKQDVDGLSMKFSEPMKNADRNRLYAQMRRLFSSKPEGTINDPIFRQTLQIASGALKDWAQEIDAPFLNMVDYKQLSRRELQNRAAGFLSRIHTPGPNGEEPPVRYEKLPVGSWADDSSVRRITLRGYSEQDRLITTKIDLSSLNTEVIQKSLISHYDRYLRSQDPYISDKEQRYRAYRTTLADIHDAVPGLFTPRARPDFLQVAEAIVKKAETTPSFGLSKDLTTNDDIHPPKAPVGYTDVLTREFGDPTTTGFGTAMSNYGIRSKRAQEYAEKEKAQEESRRIREDLDEEQRVVEDEGPHTYIQVDGPSIKESTSNRFRTLMTSASEVFNSADKKLMTGVAVGVGIGGATAMLMSQLGTDHEDARIGADGESIGDTVWQVNRRQEAGLGLGREARGLAEEGFRRLHVDIHALHLGLDGNRLSKEALDGISRDVSATLSRHMNADIDEDGSSNQSTSQHLDLTRHGISALFGKILSRR